MTKKKPTNLKEVQTLSQLRTWGEESNEKIKNMIDILLDKCDHSDPKAKELFQIASATLKEVQSYQEQLNNMLK